MIERIKRLITSRLALLSVRLGVSSHVKHSFPDDRGERPNPVLNALDEVGGGELEHDDKARYVIYRVVGNDLPPRHAKHQSKNNLEFILYNEKEFSGCEKRYIVNRIVDVKEEESIVGSLEKAGASYFKIPFHLSEYRNVPWDIEGVPCRYAPYTTGYRKLSDSEKSRVMMRIYRHKNNYAMNNNGARNAALKDGRNVANWIFPWDGNCFITEGAWRDINRDILSKSHLPYFFVPMARVMDNNELLRPGFCPVAEEEPQVVFRSDSQEEFDANYYYGRRPKVEFFWRLGIPGKWDKWRIEPWDLPCPPYSEQAGAYGSAGWVARLFSGQAHLETTKNSSLVDRGLARNEAIAGLLEQLDAKVFASHYDPQRLCFISDTVKQGAKGNNIKPDLIQALTNVAGEALERGPYSVVDKQTLPPSKNPHDYWHPAPYFWPNPIPGLPYIRKDGKRVPGTRLYEPLSDNYDRTRLQRLLDDTFVLALAGTASEDTCYDTHAVKLIRRWFLESETAMTPHLEYAQVRKGWNRNRGSSSGLIEAKDFYYFLDAVRLLEQRDALGASESSAFREWLSQYLHWLQTSTQGVKERSSLNNHGTYYDLQVGAIAAFLGEDKLLRHTLLDSRFRIVQQFAADGSQPEELKRTTTAHYCCFNLQGWIHLAQLAESCGEDLWGFEGPQGQSIRKAMEWLLPFMGKAWPYQQIDEFDMDRFYPIYHAYREHYGVPPGLENIEVPDKMAIKPLFFPHDGIRPFWQLG